MWLSFISYFWVHNKSFQDLAFKTINIYVVFLWFCGLTTCLLVWVKLPGVGWFWTTSWTYLVAGSGWSRGTALACLLAGLKLQVASPHLSHQHPAGQPRFTFMEVVKTSQQQEQANPKYTKLCLYHIHTYPTAPSKPMARPRVKVLRNWLLFDGRSLKEFVASFLNFFFNLPQTVNPIIISWVFPFLLVPHH